MAGHDLFGQGSLTGAHSKQLRSRVGAHLFYMFVNPVPYSPPKSIYRIPSKVDLSISYDPLKVSQGGIIRQATTVMNLDDHGSCVSAHDCPCFCTFATVQACASFVHMRASIAFMFMALT